MKGRQATQAILLVEDNDEDYETTIRAFKKANVGNVVQRCTDGEDALDYLHQRGKHRVAPKPSVILLDLNLPGTDGREVLGEIKTTEGLKHIPVIVLTTSTDARDIEDCYAAGANTYMQKPVDLSGFMEAVQRLKDFWLEIAILPKGHAG